MERNIKKCSGGDLKAYNRPKRCIVRSSSVALSYDTSYWQYYDRLRYMRNLDFETALEKKAKTSRSRGRCGESRTRKGTCGCRNHVYIFKFYLEFHDTAKRLHGYKTQVIEL